ncbi:pyridoxamine 5'-phosphate oxidase family protein [Listeria costaricensis]|uniref:pyridoxamine 5'-phosphate oxidase family protein n=1 Tax=Listeria costaricensis TaxID=2026604 RepID=UPI000C088171|nr:pyridoxamine 5'-phosphate oxidase family protein [Listeria costaricensis]
MEKMRRKEREVTEQQVLKAIVAKAQVAHIGFFDKEFPYVVPVNYGYEWCDADQLIFYIHGARQGKKIRLLKENPRVCVQIDCDHTLVEAGDVAADYSFAYQSIIAYGEAEIIQEESEKRHALDCLMQHATGRDLTTFEPISDKMIGGTGLIKITVQHLTGKAHHK